MNAAVLIALIALIGTALQAGLTVFGPPALQARGAERRRLETYRDPLLTAAYELQARLHNIVCHRFVEDFVFDDEGVEKQDAAIQTTLYVFGQFLAWREIIRRDVQFLRFASGSETRSVQRMLRDITETFLTKDLGHQFMIWRVEQEGFGAAMIDDHADHPACISYHTFLGRRGTMDYWLVPLERDLKTIDADGIVRLAALQNQLLALVRQLDTNGLRYPFPMENARLQPRTAGASASSTTRATGTRRSSR